MGRMKAIAAVGILCSVVGCKGKESSSKPSDPITEVVGSTKVEKIASCDHLLRIHARYPGASPAEVEVAVVQPIEEQIQKVEGVQSVHSYAVEGQAYVVAEVDDGHWDKAQADALAALGRISSFPDDVERPILIGDDGDARFVLVVAHGPVSQLMLSAWVDRFRDRLLQSASVRDVAIIAQPSREVRVDVARERLDAFRLEPEAIGAAIQTSWLDAEGSFRGADLSKVELTVGASDKKIRLADVATISEGVSERVLARLGAEPAILIASFGKADAKAGALLAETGTTAREHSRPDIEMEVVGTVTVAGCGDPGFELRGPVLVARVSAPGAKQEELGKLAEKAAQLVSSGKDAIEVVRARGEGLLGPTLLDAGEHPSFELIGLAGSERRATALAPVWRQKLAELAGARALVYSPRDSRVTVELAHADANVLAQASSDLEKRLSDLEAVAAVESSALRGAPELQFRVRDSALALGLTPQAIARHVRTALGEEEVGRLKVGRELTPILLRVLPQLEPDELPSLRIETPAGKSVALGDVAVLERSESPARIYRHDLRRTAVLSAVVRAGEDGSKLAKRIREELLPELLRAHPDLTATVR